VTKIVDKVPPMTDDRGREVMSPNATLMASCFIIMMARTAALPASSSLLAKACAARNR
jgi:hypothetical protein